MEQIACSKMWTDVEIRLFDKKIGACCKSMTYSSPTVEQISEQALLVNQGTIYLCLVRLVQQGWVKTEWGTSENNRRARFYSITRAGRKKLESETKNWQRIASVIGRLLALEGKP